LAAAESAGSTLVASVDTDLNTFATAVPAAQSDVTTDETQLVTEQTKLSSDLSGIQSAITTLGNALP
jgi:hypothetical protein